MKEFDYEHPREMDGTPYEAAKESVDQTVRIASLLAIGLSDASILIRNAELQRQIDTTGDCDATEYEDAAIAQAVVKIEASIQKVAAQLRALSLAAGYNPLSPPTEE